MNFTNAQINALMHDHNWYNDKLGCLYIRNYSDEDILVDELKDYFKDFIQAKSKGEIDEDVAFSEYVEEKSIECDAENSVWYNEKDYLIEFFKAEKIDFDEELFIDEMYNNLRLGFIKEHILELVDKYMVDFFNEFKLVKE